MPNYYLPYGVGVSVKALPSTTVRLPDDNSDDDAKSEVTRNHGMVLDISLTF